MDGLTLCRILKGSDETRFTHVLMLSARGETEAKVTGLETGADDYLVKPVDPVELTARVRVGLRLQKALADLAAKNEILEKLALTDALTGLANRRAFLDALEAELARVSRHDRPASLLFLDLDEFKRVNDTHGHAVGDEVLAGFARVLSRGCRRGDLAARIGGEEFAVLLPMTGRVPGRPRRRADPSGHRGASPGPERRGAGDGLHRGRLHRGLSEASRGGRAPGPRRRGPLPGQGGWPQPGRRRLKRPVVVTPSKRGISGPNRPRTGNSGGLPA